MHFSLKLVYPILGICILFMTLGCAEEGGVIRLDGYTPLIEEPIEDGNECVNYDKSDNENDNLYEAAHKRADNSEFVVLLDRVCEIDNFFCERLQGRDGPHTLLLPTNEAVRSFLAENPNILNEEINLRAIVKYHSLVSPLQLNEFRTGQIRSMNRELLPVTKDGNFCISFASNGGRLVISNDFCANGYIHTVDKVLIPNRNFK